MSTGCKSFVGCIIGCIHLCHSTNSCSSDGDDDGGGAGSSSSSNSGQGDHLSGKPGNIREFDSCQGNVREKILSGQSGLKLFIVSYIFASIVTLLSLCISFRFWIMHCGILSPTTDNNTSNGMI